MTHLSTVIPGWCESTRPQMRNCTSGNLEIPGSCFARPGMTCALRVSYGSMMPEPAQAGTGHVAAPIHRIGQALLVTPERGEIEIVIGRVHHVEAAGEA